MDAAPEKTVGQELQRVGDVDGDGAVEGPHPLPAAVLAAHLQGRDGLAEQQGEAAEVGVALDPDVVEPRVGLGVAGVVLHVPQVAVREGVVAVEMGEVVLGKLEDDGEEGQELLDDVMVDVAGELLDLGLVGVDH